MEIYWLARDLNGFFVGRHQFIVIITGDKPSYFNMPRSNKPILSQKIDHRYGLILGAHNIKPADQQKSAHYNRLIFKAFEAADLAAAKEFLTASKPTGHKVWEYYKPAEAQKIIPIAGITIEQLARQILDAIDFYIVNEETTNIAYPTPWLGKNSNSWARSIMNIVQANLPNGAGDFDGADAGNDVSIPAMYFKGICSPCTIQNPVHR